MFTFFLAPVLIAAVGLLAVVIGVVRFVLARRALATQPSTDPPRVTWSSPIVLVPVGLMALGTAIILALFMFWKACAGGPDLC